MPYKWLGAWVLILGYGAGCTGPADSYAKIKVGEPVAGDLLSRGALAGTRWQQESNSRNVFPIGVAAVEESCVAFCDGQGRVVLKHYASDSSYGDLLTLSNRRAFRMEVLVPPDWNASERSMKSLVAELVSRKDSISVMAVETQSSTSNSSSRPVVPLDELLSKALAILEHPTATSVPASSVTPIPHSLAAYVMLTATIAEQSCPPELLEPELLEGLSAPGFHQMITSGLTSRFEIENLGGGRIRMSRTGGFTMPLLVYFIGWMIVGD